jgi:hypothetical protein
MDHHSSDVVYPRRNFPHSHVVDRVNRPRTLGETLRAGSAPGALALMDLLLRSTWHDFPHFSDRLLIDAFIILRNLGLTLIQCKPGV